MVKLVLYIKKKIKEKTSLKINLKEKKIIEINKIRLEYDELFQGRSYSYCDR